MPRTKQIHPRNLRDKIEEAQKELQGPDDLDKGAAESGAKGIKDTVKGVKRKKVVAENHLKKIPKPPVRNSPQAKRSASRDSDREKASPNAPCESLELQKDLSNLLVHNGGLQDERRAPVQESSQEPGLSSDAVVNVAEPHRSMQTEKHGLSQQIFSFCNGKAEDCETGDKLKFSEVDKLPLVFHKQTQNHSVSASLLNENSISKTKSSTYVSNSNSPSYANTAFDVLLKAMEPELNTLTQSKYSLCRVEPEILGQTDEKEVQSSALSTRTRRVLNLGSLSQESGSGPQYYSSISQTIQVPISGKSDQTQIQTVSHLHCQKTQNISQGRPQHQQQALCQSFHRLSTHQQNQENHQLQQIYNITLTSSLGHSPPSTITQVLAQNQLVSNSVQSVAASQATCIQIPVATAYKPPQVTSIVNHGVEQMCNILTKDQKAKKQGKYICEYCNRACAKPSVLLKHIRSHTGERPYPCVTCGFSFKTKSNLYKHKKSHAHAIKLGLVLRTDSSGTSQSLESEKAFSTHSDVEESGESEEECAADEKQIEQRHLELESVQIPNSVVTSQKFLQNACPISAGQQDSQALESTLQQKSLEPKVTAALPKVVVHPVNVSPLRADSPKVTESTAELAVAQWQGDMQSANMKLGLAVMSSLKETDNEDNEAAGLSQLEEEERSHPVTGHAQLQRQQATDFSQQQHGKCLLSPRSLGSTDSGYFSRSESADQNMSPPSPFVKLLPTSDIDASKNILSYPPRLNQTVASAMQMSCVEKPSVLPCSMRPPMETKTLEERISKLISDNEAVVDDKQLDSVKPRRTSLSRRGSIDSPKSYIFKDSFQFDLKPMGRRTSSSSDIPKSPFTPTEKSKQVFLLSVPSHFPSLECLPITRSNSMPATPGYSTVPPNVIPTPHPLRGSQSFDDKIGSFYDDVFVSGPSTTLQAAHPRTLVRQTAIEDFSTNEGHTIASTRSVDESCHGINLSTEGVMPRSKSFEQGTIPEKVKKSQQGRGTTYECETCRNRYRKLENFENHKKFYCSELHGPKTKTIIAREAEQNSTVSSTPTQILHNRVTGTASGLEQPPQIRKRRKMKSVGDDDEPLPVEGSSSSGGMEASLCQNTKGPASSFSQRNVAAMGAQQPSSVPPQTSCMQSVARDTEFSTESRLSPIIETNSSSVSNTLKERGEMKRQGSGISVIQHTNSLSRPHSFEKSESFERASPVLLQEVHKIVKQTSLSTVGASQKEGPSAHLTSSHHQQQISCEGTMAGQRVVPNECNAFVQQSRLVRQHNIQVPEILVTEEPDREHDSQGNEEEKSAEKFNWPQRSESLSKLPTEKLPPKKKRIRLTEMEHSSAESSLDSTLSRSLSRDSSLSCCSSFSASFDREEVPKAESPLKVQGMSKSAEFLMLPVGSNALGVPNPHYREMRRAASEQISCQQPSIEATADYRSKSFDCGSMSPSRSASPKETTVSRHSPAILSTGHVPLIERRRGPLVRQMSLNIGPESHHVQLKPSTSCQQNQAADVGVMSCYKPQVSDRSCQAVNLNYQLNQVVQLPQKLQNEQQTLIQNPNPANQPYVQPPFVLGSPDQWQQSARAPTPQAIQQASALKVTNQGTEKATHSLPSTETQVQSFAPKYQLQVNPLQASQKYLHSSVQVSANPLPVITPPVSGSVGEVTSNVPAKHVEMMSNLYLLPQFQQMIPGHSTGQIPQLASFVVPLGIQGNMPSYNFAAISTLPQILVTQDQVNQPTMVVCKVNSMVVPPSEAKVSHIPKYQDHHSALKTSQSRTFACESSYSEHEHKSSFVTGPLNSIQKIPPTGLFPQQEATASSKRMLSPANSLDIAMEKHQKRAKDESGAACTTDARSQQLVNMRIADLNKQKKPLLVRQVCTIEPAEGLLDQEVVSHLHGKNTESSNSPSDSCVSEGFKSRVTDAIKEVLEWESVNRSPSRSLTRWSPVPSGTSQPVTVQSSPSRSLDNSQERRSPSLNNHTKPFSIQGQVKLGATLSGVNARDMHRLSFPSLKTATTFTWCYLMKRKQLHEQQNDTKTSAYATWSVSSDNPNPIGLPTKVALSLLNSRQKAKETLFTQAINTRPRFDILVYSSKWKTSMSKILSNQNSTVSESSNKEKSDAQASEQEKDISSTKNEPRRVKIFDGGYKSNEEYVYVRGRGRGKYICEECGIRCKKPSMLRKHIRTHTDVRPYHCNYCNFSFKTKGNLTKHMKSKAHSKKCMEMGVSIGLIEEQEGDETGDKQRLGYERPGSDVEDSDGADEDDNENEDDDEDSQAESVLSATPSVTASPQHHPYQSSQSEELNASIAEEEFRITKNSAEIRASIVNTLPKALLAQITASNAISSSMVVGCPVPAVQFEPEEKRNPVGKLGNAEADRPTTSAPRSPCHQMSIDYPETEENMPHSSAQKSTDDVKETCLLTQPSPPVDRGTQTSSVLPPSAPSSHQAEGQQQNQLPSGLSGPQTHLFSHLPLHSQQQSRSPYSMVPIGGIQLVPAGLAAYSTFVPIQAGPVQLTIPAVSVIHRTASPLSDKGPEKSGPSVSPVGVTEVNNIVPCIPIGQVNVPSLQSLSAPSLQPLPALGLETVNILGLANANLGPQIHPSSLTLNALGLQVLAANPSPQSNPSPQTHIPGLQILNIALPTLIPSVSPLTIEGQGSSETLASSNKTGDSRPEQIPMSLPVGVNISQFPSVISPQLSPSVQVYDLKSTSEPAATSRQDPPKQTGEKSTDGEKTDMSNHLKLHHEIAFAEIKRVPTPEPFLKARSERSAKSPAFQTKSPERQVQRRGGTSRRQVTVQYSDVSSDDEDRLVIAT
ncbi:zinc finger protein 40 isoform X1 [Latimeria chalumnae]|uniref:zinc finger protein 40 isoform X1 n=1 Tax=Latimeria chalumnae TaxID=7897 RepID=UPI00313BA722